MRPPRVRRGLLGRLLLFWLLLGLGGLGGGLLGLGGGLLGLARLFLRAAGFLLLAALGLLLELGRDRGVVLGAEVDLVGGRGIAPVAGLQILLALERLDLLNGHVELMRDPGVGTTLSHPPTDLVKLRTQGPAAHTRAGRLAQEGSGASGAGPIGDSPNEH